MFTPNLEKMKEQLEIIKNPKAARSDDNDNSYWKLEPGDHQFRLLCLPDGNIMKLFHWHYDVNGKNYLCAKRSFNKDCAICDLASNIWKEYDASEPKDETLKETAKNLFASKRYYFPVLVRGFETEGPKIYSCGVRAAEQIMQIALDEDNKDMFDTEKGFDLKLKYTLVNPSDKRSATTTITAARKASPLLAGATKEEVEALFASIPDFNTLFEIPNPDEVHADLDSFISSLDVENIGTVSYEEGKESSPVLDAFKTLKA